MKATVASALHVGTLGLLITTASLVAIGLATLFPASGLALTDHLCLICGSRGGVDAVLNILLFVPLGAGLSMIGVPATFAILGMAALSALIETTQFLFILGRDATIGDVLTNTGGGAIGFAIAHYARTMLHPSSRIAVWLTTGWCVAWLAIQALSSFGFARAVPQSQYYGQIARRLGNFEPFRGRVLDARIGNMAVPDTRVRNSPAMQRQILGGAPISATVLTSHLPHGMAPIVRIADGEQREIILLAQNREDLVFAVRTGGTVLRVRPPVFSMPHVFSSDTNESISQTVSVSARYDSREARLSAQSHSTLSERRIPIHSSLGWSFLLPFQWLIEGTMAERVIGWFWTSFLLIPLGYWATHLIYPRQMRILAWRTALVTLAVVAVAVTGMVLSPRTFGIQPASLLDWFAAVIGVVAGCALAARALEALQRQRSRDLGDIHVPCGR